MKKHLTYCVCSHGAYERTKGNLDSHKEFALSLNEFDVSFVEINTEDYKNWGGMSGLLSMYLDTNPELLEDGYLVSCKDDVMMNDKHAMNNAITVLEEKSEIMNLAYVGHVNHNHLGGLDGYKTCPEKDKKFGAQSKWTDGGLYLFKNKKLLEIKNKLGVLPGHIKNGEDVPLPMDSTLDFENVQCRVEEHEVGFPTRLNFYGYDIWGINDSNIVHRLNTAYSRKKDNDEK